MTDGILKFVTVRWRKNLDGKVKHWEKKRDGWEYRLPSDGFDLRDQPRIKERVCNPAVGGPYVEREDQLSGISCVRRTRDSDGCEVGVAGREVLWKEINIYETMSGQPHFKRTSHTFP